jgi:hypothetical protein
VLNGIPIGIKSVHSTSPVSQYTTLVEVEEYVTHPAFHWGSESAKSDNVKDWNMTLRNVIRRSAKETNKKVRSIVSKGLGYCTQPWWREVECLFVLSTGRTGTKTCARLLDLSPRIEAFHEPHPQLLEERKAARTEVYSKEQKYARIFACSKGWALFRSKRRGTVYAETSARLTFFAPVIASMVPNAKFLFIHRDPTEVIRSGMRRGWYVDHPADYARVEPVEEETFYEGWESRDQFSKICWYWNIYNKFALRFRKQVDPSRVFTINADDLFSGTVVHDIFEFLGMESPSSEQIERVLGKKLNAQKKSQFPSKENWSPEMYRTLYDIAGETMHRLGYRTSERILAEADTGS